MKEKILKLRLEGKTYSQIQKELNCSRGTISYHCGDGQKIKSYNRNKTNSKEFKNYIKRRICYFQKRSENNTEYEKDRELTFTVDEFLKKFGKITNCALTGQEINLETDRNWQIDHIIPKSKGGDNSLSNCQILTKDVNMMKHGLDQKELLELCKKIILHCAVE